MAKGHWPMAYLAALILIGVLAFVIIRRAVKRVTILEYQRGVFYSRGTLKRVLGPGVYQYVTYRSTIQTLDMRPRFVTIAGQEVLSADNISLKVSIAAKYEISDPVRAIQNSEHYQEALYLELQVALREIVSSTKIDVLLETRQTLSQQLMARALPNVEALGLNLLSATIKDIMFPGELKRVFAQVVKAQKDGLAALERARGESAALRNLANAAKLLENNPALMQLRLLQTVSESSGNTVVFGLPAQATPLPLPIKNIEQNTPDTPKLPHEPTS